MPISKEKMQQMFEAMRGFCKDEANVQEAFIAMTELLSMFYDYLEEKKIDLEALLEDKTNATK